MISVFSSILSGHRVLCRLCLYADGFEPKIREKASLNVDTLLYPTASAMRYSGKLVWVITSFATVSLCCSM